MESYKSQLASQVVQGGKAGNGYFREEKEDEGVYPELQNRMEKLSDQLQSQRKQSKAPNTYPKTQDFQKYTVKGSYPIHESSKPGIVDLDIHPLNENYIVSGGRDS